MLNPDEATQLFNLYNHTWNTLGALIRSLNQKKQDGSWDCSYTLKDEADLYDIEPYDQPSNLPPSPQSDHPPARPALSHQRLLLAGGV